MNTKTDKMISFSIDTQTGSLTLISVSEPQKFSTQWISKNKIIFSLYIRLLLDVFWECCWNIQWIKFHISMSHFIQSSKLTEMKFHIINCSKSAFIKNHALYCRMNSTRCSFIRKLFHQNNQKKIKNNMFL